METQPCISLADFCHFRPSLSGHRSSMFDGRCRCHVDRPSFVFWFLLLNIAISISHCILFRSLSTLTFLRSLVHLSYGDPTMYFFGRFLSFSSKSQWTSMVDDRSSGWHLRILASTRTWIEKRKKQNRHRRGKRMQSVMEIVSIRLLSKKKNSEKKILRRSKAFFRFKGLSLTPNPTLFSPGFIARKGKVRNDGWKIRKKTILTQNTEKNAVCSRVGSIEIFRHEAKIKNFFPYPPLLQVSTIPFIASD